MTQHAATKLAKQKAEKINDTADKRAEVKRKRDANIAGMKRRRELEKERTHKDA